MGTYPFRRLSGRARGLCLADLYLGYLLRRHGQARPLSFLAQFDCGALAAMDPEGLLPRTGILSFFYEMESARWGFDPADAGCGRVYWFDGSQPLAPAPFPHELEEEFRLPRLRVQAKADRSFASWADFAQVHPELDELFEDYAEAHEVMGGSGECSKLLGWPDVIQGNMTLECELVRRDITSADWRTTRPIWLSARARLRWRTGGCCSSWTRLKWKILI
ncbi:MAG: DUF1963 domain-containing protein [Butyricicoccus pullicaecorum]